VDSGGRCLGRWGVWWRLNIKTLRLLDYGRGYLFHNVGAAGRAVVRLIVDATAETGGEVFRFSFWARAWIGGAAVERAVNIFAGAGAALLSL
jgi:hypothetical protein